MEEDAGRQRSVCFKVTAAPIVNGRAQFEKWVGAHNSKSGRAAAIGRAEIPNTKDKVASCGPGITRNNGPNRYYVPE